MQEFMEKSRQLFVEQGFPEEAVSIKSQERQVGIARDIAREAQKDYDLVVVGRLGVSKLKDLVWGSIANKLVGHLSHIPLCVVGGAPEAGKILVALDTSEEATATVDYLGTMVDATDWGIILFHVIRGLDFVLPESGEIVQDIEGAVEAFLEQAVGRLEKAGLRPDQISTKTVSGVASRAKAIVEEAKDSGCGTIVVGRRGLSRVEEFFMGRVSKKVMQLAQEMAVWVVS
jgi:nucleotide-binding universal stress UspA family protein